MARSKQALSYSWLHVLRMLDKAAWSLAKRKVHFSTLVEKNEITDHAAHNSGAEYTEYVFEAHSYVPEFHIFYVRLWLIEKKTNVPQVEKIVVTSRTAEVLGEWDGTNQKERSFEAFLRNMNRLSWQYLYSLLLARSPLAPYTQHGVQMSWMNKEITITQQGDGFIVAQAIDDKLRRPAAEILLRGSNGQYWAETIKVFESLSIETVSTTHHYSENLWSNEYKETN